MSTKNIIFSTVALITIVALVLYSNPVSAATVFNDTFTEATNKALSAHTPDTGTSWTVQWQTGASSDIRVVATSDTITATATVANSGVMYKANGTYSSADYSVSATVKAGCTGSNRCYLIVRMTDTENMYALRFTTGAANTRMYKKVAGTWTALGSFLTDPAINDVVKLDVLGPTLTYYYNGILQNTQVDIDLASAGTAGIAMGGGTELAASTDDILVTSELDDFIVTDATGGGGGGSVATSTEPVITFD